MLLMLRVAVVVDGVDGAAVCCFLFGVADYVMLRLLLHVVDVAVDDAC